MPIITSDTVQKDSGDGAGDPCGPYAAELYSDTGGLTQFGAFVEILPPGSRSSVKHWHKGEDEMVYMLAGEALLHEGDTVTPLLAGQPPPSKQVSPEATASRTPATQRLATSSSAQDRQATQSPTPTTTASATLNSRTLSGHGAGRTTTARPPTAPTLRCAIRRVQSL